MTGLFYPDGLALNPLNGDIYVAVPPITGSTGKVAIYPSGSTGNIAPTGVIEGMRTAIHDPQHSHSAQPAKSTFRTLAATP